MPSTINNQQSNMEYIMQTNKIGDMPFRDEEKKFSRTSDRLVKHTYNNFNFLTVGDQEPEDKMKALAVTLRDSGDFDSFQDSDFADLPIICGSSEFDVWQNVRAYETTENGYMTYAVMTDREADQAWDEALDSYIDECLDIPENVRHYFDEDKWKDDARIDGRGHSLNHYDGGEEEANINDVDYYIYRRN